MTSRLRAERVKVAEEEQRKARLAMGTELELKHRELEELGALLKSRDVKLAEALQAQATVVRKQRSCCSQANATPEAPPCATVISATAGIVASRAQSRCHSLMTAIQVTGTAPACTIRRTAMSCASRDTAPDASVTKKTS